MAEQGMPSGSKNNSSLTELGPRRSSRIKEQLPDPEPQDEWEDPLVWKMQGVNCAQDSQWLKDKLVNLRKGVEAQGINPAFIAEVPIVFPNGKARDQWKMPVDGTIPTGRNLSGWKNMDVYQLATEFCRRPKLGKKCWIIPISGPFYNWVLYKDPKLWTGWHAVAAAVIQRPNRGGKILLIKDCDRLDVSRSDRVKEHITGGAIKALYDELRGPQNKGKVEVRLHSSTTHREKSRCFDITMDQIFRWAQIEDKEWDEEGEDERLMGEEWQILRP